MLQLHTSNMPRERTYIMIKPDGVQRGIVGQIIARFENKGFKLVAMKLCSPTKEHLETHYADLKSKKFFPGLIEYMMMGPVCCMVWEGDNAVKTGRVMLGATNPADSAPGTIRGDLCIHVGRNICHGSDSVESANAEINLWFSEAEQNTWGHHSEGWVYENVEEPKQEDGGAAASGTSNTVGTTVHAPLAAYPGANEAFNEYITYSDDASIGQDCPDLSSLKMVQGDALKAGDGRVKIVFFWGKYLKWQCWPTMIGMCEIAEKHPEIDVVGIAADKKEKDVLRFMEKGECRADCPLAFDMNWVLKDAFRNLMKVGALAVPHAFLINGEGKIVWRQAYSAGYQFATMGFYEQLLHVLAGEDISNPNGPNPEPEEDLGEEVESKDVFACQEVADAIW